MSKNGQSAENNLPDGFAFIDLDDMTQGHLERWQRKFNAEYSTGQHVYNGAIVKASIAAGWFVKCPWEVEDVVKQPLKGNLVPVIAKAVDDFYVEVMALANPDPNS